MDWSLRPYGAAVGDGRGHFRDHARPATPRHTSCVEAALHNGMPQEMLTSIVHQGNELMPVDTKAATDRLMRFLAVEGVTGQEAAIGRELAAALKESGVPAKAIRLDDANTRIPVPTETGNLIVDLPGRGALHNQPRIMFMTHMDTVPLCAGAKPKKSGRKIVNEARTALGGDNRCGCGVLVTLAAEPREAQARPSADHAAVLRARGERALWRAPRQAGRARLARDGLQL